MLDRKTFLRPIAHRGLHDAARGRVENTAPAFEAAIAKGYGIECDLRAGAGGLPLVFHDATLGRLIAGHKGPIAEVTASEARRLRYKACDTHILSFAELLDLVDDRVPLLVEIKSEWQPPDAPFLRKVAKLASGYQGPLALMSFDPGVMAVLRDLAPAVPRGIVSGSYRGSGWWNRAVSRTRAAALRDLHESAAAAPSFYAYEIDALPTPVTEYARHIHGLPVFTWTVRTAKQRATAAKWADTAIFEGFEP